MFTDEMKFIQRPGFGNWILLGVGLWGGAKGNSHMGKGHRAGASEYFGHISSLLLFLAQHKRKEINERKTKGCT